MPCYFVSNVVSSLLFLLFLMQFTLSLSPPFSHSISIFLHTLVFVCVCFRVSAFQCYIATIQHQQLNLMATMRIMFGRRRQQHVPLQITKLQSEWFNYEKTNWIEYNACILEHPFYFSVYICYAVEYVCLLECIYLCVLCVRLCDNLACSTFENECSLDIQYEAWINEKAKREQCSIGHLTFCKRFRMAKKSFLLN